MRHLYALLALLLVFGTSKATAQGWDRTYGGNDADGGYAVAAMPDGGFVAGGYFGMFNSLNGYVVRTDAAGDTLWTRVLDLSPLDERVYDLVPLQDGGVLAVASASFGTPINATRPWLVRLDADGNVVFSTEDGLSLDLPVNAGIVRGAERPDGSFVIVGGSNGYTSPGLPWRALVSATGDLIDFEEYAHLIPGFGSGTYVESVTSTPDGGFALGGSAGGGLGVAFLWKFDAAADSSWVRFYGDEFLRTAFNTRVAPDGSFILAGCALPNCGTAAALRADAKGEVIWSNTYPGINAYSEARDFTLRPDGTGVLLRTSSSAVGSTRLDTELVEISASGEEIGAVLLPGGASTTQGQGSVFLDRLEWAGSDGWFIAVGRRFDNGNPSEADLYLYRNQAAASQTTANTPAFPSGDEVLAVYPNPAAQRVTLDGLNATSRVQVFDLLGRDVLSADRSSGSTLDVQALPSGVYVLRVTAQDGTVQQARFTVQR